MRRKLLIPLGLAVALTAASALAEDILHFTNGTTMAVESHSIEEGTVRVNLGGQAFMEFPLEQIEKIETAMGDVQLPPPGANRMVPRPTPKGGVVTGTVPSRLRRDQWVNREPRAGMESVTTDRNGIAVYRPFGANPAKNKAKFCVTGRRELTNRPPAANPGEGVVGSTRVGARNVLPPKQTGATRQQPVGLSAKGGSPAPKKKQ